MHVAIAVKYTHTYTHTHTKRDIRFMGNLDLLHFRQRDLFNWLWSKNMHTLALQNVRLNCIYRTVHDLHNVDTVRWNSDTIVWC